jgi:GTP-binding protein
MVFAFWWMLSKDPMPQTRFVLGKAIDLGINLIVIINKVDKENCRPEEVHEQVFDLMFNLGATEDQLDFQTHFTVHLNKDG